LILWTLVSCLHFLLRSSLTANVEITGLSPPAGPIAGASLVTVAGSGFYSGARCLFGSTPDAGATVVTSTRIVCVSPVYASAANVTLEVTNNGQDYTTLQTMFTYYGMYLFL